MIKLTEGDRVLADWLVEFTGLTIGISRLSLLTNNLYFWADVTGPVSRATLRRAKRELDAAIAFKCCAQITSSDPVAVRFAEFFGFKTVGEKPPYLMMEKN